MFRFFTFLLAVVFYMPIANAEPMCPVYHFSCLPEVNHVSIEKHKLPCWKPPHFQDDDAMRALGEEKNIFMPWPKLYGKEELIHTCTIGGREVKIKMDSTPIHYKKDGVVCWETYNKTMRTTWWLDGVKIIDDVGFIDTCEKMMAYEGNTVHRIKAKLNSKTQENTYVFLDFKIFDIADKGEMIEKSYSVKLKPPFSTKSSAIKPPITNDNIH